MYRSWPAVSKRSEWQQQLELRDLAQAVIVPLKGGLSSFNKVSMMLLNVNENVVLPGSYTFRKIRREIENMKKLMEQSEQVAIRELHRLDQQTESLTAEKTRFANQKRRSEQNLRNLRTELKSHHSTLESYREALEDHKRNLRSAENTLDRMREKRDNAEMMRNVGFIVTPIPVLGWVAGPAMIVVGQIEMNEASDRVKTARKEVRECKSQVSSYSDKVSKHKDLIRQAECDIQEADQKIHETQVKLWRLSERQEFVTDIQAKMRRAVNKLGELCGVGNVAELQTRRQILVEPVMNVMEEMTTALGQISGEELLHTQGIKRLMRDIKKNHNRLKERAVTDTSSDDDYY